MLLLLCLILSWTTCKSAFTKKHAIANHAQKEVKSPLKSRYAVRGHRPAEGRVECLVCGICVLCGGRGKHWLHSCFLLLLLLCLKLGWSDLLVTLGFLLVSPHCFRYCSKQQHRVSALQQHRFGFLVKHGMARKVDGQWFSLWLVSVAGLVIDAHWCHS